MKELIKIQSELKAPKNQFNSFGKYKYRNCEDILEALKPLLLKYECTLTIHDEVKEVGGLVFIESTASIQKDNEGRSVTAQAGIDPNRKGMDVGQSFGASSSYSRKYALSGLLLIDDSDLDPDASNDHQPKSTQPLKKDALIELKKDTPEWKQVVKFVEDNKSKGIAVLGEKLNAKYSISNELKKELATICNQ
jgi:hypothetical protein